MEKYLWVIAPIIGFVTAASAPLFDIHLKGWEAAGVVSVCIFVVGGINTMLRETPSEAPVPRVDLNLRG